MGSPRVKPAKEDFYNEPERNPDYLVPKMEVDEVKVDEFYFLSESKSPNASSSASILAKLKKIPPQKSITNKREHYPRVAKQMGLDKRLAEELESGHGNLLKLRNFNSTSQSKNETTVIDKAMHQRRR